MASRLKKRCLALFVQCGLGLGPQDGKVQQNPHTHPVVPLLYCLNFNQRAGRRRSRCRFLRTKRRPAHSTIVSRSFFSLFKPHHIHIQNMSSRGILDSSPLRPGASEASRSGGPPKRKSLKRSASTASLLTPPRTVRRKDRYSRAKSRSKSRTSDRGADVDTESEGDDDDDEDEHQPVGRLNLGRKRQRTDRLEKVAAALTGEDAENPFWDGATKEKRGVTDAEVEDEDEEEHTDRERSPTPPLVRFKKNKAPVSPPPSRRRKTVTVAEPTTPKSKIRPVRDSPNNPFLDDSPSSVVDDASPKTPKEHEEKPEITYVL